MKNIIYIILFLAVNFGFGQKNYAFNLYTSYGSTDREGNNSVYVTFSDTLNDQHTLRIFSKNDTIVSVVLFDKDLYNKYIFKLNKKSLNSIDFTKDLTNYHKEQIDYYKKGSSKFCNRFKHYDVNSEDKNDSISVDTFTFYTNKNKKTIKLIVTVESLKSKQLINESHSEILSIIPECIDFSFKSKIIKNITSEHILKEGFSIKIETKLIEINTTNFSINVK